MSKKKKARRRHALKALTFPPRPPRSLSPEHQQILDGLIDSASLLNLDGFKALAVLSQVLANVPAYQKGGAS
jgi:hypothetical protein